MPTFLNKKVFETEKTTTSIKTKLRNKIQFFSNLNSIYMKVYLPLIESLTIVNENWSTKTNSNKNMCVIECFLFSFFIELTYLGLLLNYWLFLTLFGANTLLLFN